MSENAPGGVERCGALRGAAANRWPAPGGRRRYLRCLTLFFLFERGARRLAFERGSQ